MARSRTGFPSQDIIQSPLEADDLPQGLETQLGLDLFVEELGRVVGDRLQAHDTLAIVALETILEFRQTVPRQPRVHFVVRPAGDVLGSFPSGLPLRVVPFEFA